MSAPDDASGPPLPVGVGRYRVLGSLGHGSMGRVLCARDPNLDRDVAVKLLREDLKLGQADRDSLYARMRQEARASARLSHPNIVGLYDIGEEPGVGLYLVFEYVEGPTLEQELEHGPLPPPRAAELCRELGSALGAAHRAGIVHRDIKPANVILAAAGAKIADFGIARLPGSTLTQDGRVLGTPAYSAPEAIETGELGPAADQFSLAATLYEAISGRRAFPGDDAVTVARNITSTTPEPVAIRAGVDPEVDQVLARGLAKTPSERFASAVELTDALAEALTPAPRAQMPTLPDVRHRAARDARATRRDLTVLGLGMVLGASLTASVVLLWPRSGGDPATSPAPPARRRADAPEPGVYPPAAAGDAQR